MQFEKLRFEVIWVYLKVFHGVLHVFFLRFELFDSKSQSYMNSSVLTWGDLIKRLNFDRFIWACQKTTPRCEEKVVEEERSCRPE